MIVEIVTFKQSLKISIDHDIAIKLSGHLYQKVELKGDAIWAPTYQMELVHFTLREYRLMPKPDPQLLAEKLSKIPGFDWADTDKSNNSDADTDPHEPAAVEEVE